MQFIKVYILLFLIGALLFSCSKKKETEEIIEPTTKFSFQTTRDFLLFTQKGYYFLINEKDSILQEGILENGKNYTFEFQKIQELNFAYMVGTYDGTKKDFKGYYYLDIPTNEVVVLHKYLTKDINQLYVNSEGVGKAVVNFNCAANTNGTNYSILSETNHNYVHISRQPGVLLNVDIPLYSQESEIMLIRTSRLTPISTEDFFYATSKVQVGNTYTFDCNTPDFTTSRGMMKDLHVDLLETSRLNNASLHLSLNVFPINKEINNIGYRYNPYGLYYIGNVYHTSRFSSLMFPEVQTLWYPLEWIEDKREHLEVFIEVQENNFSGTDFKPINYWQKHEGNYPPPINLGFYAPVYSLDIEENNNIYTSYQSGEPYLAEIEYSNVIGSYSDREQYNWVVSFSAKKPKVSWKLPFFSDKVISYFKINLEYGTFDGVDMQPTAKRFQVKEGMEYHDYIQERFSEPQPLIYKDMNKWTTTTYIKEEI